MSDAARRILVEMTREELDAWERFKRGSVFDPVRSSEAAPLLRMTEREARRAAARWFKQQASGRRPPVRVERTSAADNAHWLFDRADCEAYGTRPERAGPRLVEADAENPNDPAAIARAYLHGTG